MLRYSMSRKTSAILHFPKELVQQLTSDLLPLEGAGFFPLKVDATVEVSGSLGQSGALIPIKELQELLGSALSQIDSLHTSIATAAQQTWDHISAALVARPQSDHSSDLTLSSLELSFENGIKFKLSHEAPALILEYPVSFQHAVEFDLGSQGERLHHGHDARAEITLGMDGESATRFLMQEKPKLDATMAATGEMIVRAIAESLNESEYQQYVFKVSLKETEKNTFITTFDKLR
jgi:hypothetical protein